MSKIFGFLLGVVVALAGPAVFGVLAAKGGIELNAKEMALAYGIGALIFWAVVSYFSGAAALGAFLVFGGMVYAVHWIPNRMTNFLNDVPGVTTGMIEGIKQYTLNGVVPILAAISLVYGIQSIVRSAQRRRRVRAEAERTQREQELAQAQQAAEAAPYQPASPYPVAGGDYQAPAENRYGGHGNNSYEDLFDDEPEPVQPRNQADEQTATFATSEAAEEYADHQPDTSDETQLVPTDGDATALVPTTSPEHSDKAEKPAAQEETVVQSQESVAQGDDPAEDETQLTPTSTMAAPAYTPPAAPSVGTPVASAPDTRTTASAAPSTAEQPTVAAPVKQPSTPTPPAPAAPPAEAPAEPAQPSEAPAAPAQPSEATAVQPTAPAPQAAQAPAPQAPAPQAPAPQAPAPQAPRPLPPQAAEPPQAPEASALASQETAALTPAPPAPAPQEPAPSAPAPQEPAPHTPEAPAPASRAPQEPAPPTPAPPAPTPASQEPPSSAQPSPAPFAPRSPSSSTTDDRSTQETPQAATTTVDPAPAVRAEAVQQREEVGQQYRERMDDSTGEHTFGAFENPMQSDELRPQAPRVMDLPGQFRPAGT